MRLKIVTTTHTEYTETRILCAAHALETPLLPNESSVDAELDDVCEMCAAGEPVSARAQPAPVAPRGRIASWLKGRA